MHRRRVDLQFRIYAFFVEDQPESITPDLNTLSSAIFLIDNIRSVSDLNLATRLFPD